MYLGKQSKCLKTDLRTRLKLAYKVSIFLWWWTEVRMTTLFMSFFRWPWSGLLEGFLVCVLSSFLPVLLLVLRLSSSSLVLVTTGALFNQLTLYLSSWRRNSLHKKGDRVKVPTWCTSIWLHTLLKPTVLSIHAHWRTGLSRTLKLMTHFFPVRSLKLASCHCWLQFFHLVCRY